MLRSRSTPDWSAGIIPLPEPMPGVGKQQLLLQIVNSMRNLPFLLRGPPGVGKKSLIQLAAPKLNLTIKGAYDLGHVANEKSVP